MYFLKCVSLYTRITKRSILIIILIIGMGRQKLHPWYKKYKVGCIIGSQDNKSVDRNKKLEIGAGTLNHLPYELGGNNQYDIVEPFQELYLQSKYLNYINKIYNDISEIRNRRYERIISIAAFEHVLDLPGLNTQITQLLTDDGLGTLHIIKRSELI